MKRPQCIHAIIGQPSQAKVAHLITMIRADSSSQSDTWMIWSILFGIVIASIVKACSYLWPDLLRWWGEKTSRDWPSVSAVIDIVAVAKEVESGGKGPPIVTYMALLTYSYRNPDLQTGDYNRAFGYEDEAQEWTNTMKGRTVSVRVDPSDPARSILRTEDINAADPYWSGK